MNASIKTFHVLCFFITLSSAPAVMADATKNTPSTVIQIPEEAAWSVRLTEACVASAKKQKSSKIADIDKGCGCVVRNSLKLSSNEASTKDAIKDLKWILRYYQNQVSPSELENDPLAVAELIFHFGSECARNPSYQHDFGPNE